MTPDYQCKICYEYVDELDVCETFVGDYCFQCLLESDKPENRILGVPYAD